MLSPSATETANTSPSRARPHPATKGVSAQPYGKDIRTWLYRLRQHHPSYRDTDTSTERLSQPPHGVDISVAFLTKGVDDAVIGEAF